MKLHRPHIPLRIQCTVALRQCGRSPDAIAYLLEDAKYHLKGQLGTLLRKAKRELVRTLGGEVDGLQLDHDPALSLRVFDPVTRRYTPDANDPDFLLYRPKRGGTGVVLEHHIKTNVRGEGALRSDLGERMHRRRMDENRGLRKRKPKQKIRSRGFISSTNKLTPKVKWAKGRWLRGKKSWR